jgi:hypothetical protein
MIPAANASKDPNSADWPKSYYNPSFGWTSVKNTPSKYSISSFFTSY